MPKFKQGFREKVLDNADIFAYISRYTRLEKKGGRYFGLCPFPDHNENTGSFSVVPEKGFFYCFGCHKGGNIIDFIMEMNHSSYYEAMETLCREMNITPEYEDGGSSSEFYTAKKNLYEINREAGNFFYKNLVGNQNALSYLAQRGITPRAIRTFGLGLSPSDNSLSLYLLKKGFKKKDIEAANLARENERGFYDFFRDRIMYPILDISNNIVGFGGRIMTKSSSGPKYLNSPENSIFYKRSTLYNLNKAKDAITKRSDPIIMVEGYMDVISLYDHGIKAACATLGTALGEKHAKLIKRYTDNVILCYDGDSPGRNAAVKGSGILSEAGLNAKVMTLPGNHDPDSYVREFGAKEFLARAAEAVHGEDFKINELKEKYDLSDIQQRSAFLNEAASVVALVNDEIKWDYYARRLASLTDSDIQTVKSRIVQINKAAKPDETSPKEAISLQEEAPQKELTPMQKNELAVLKYVLSSHSNYQKYLNAGGINFFDGENALLYEAMANAYEKNPNIVDISNEIIYTKSSQQRLALINCIDKDISDNELPFYVNVLTINIYNAKLKELKKELDELQATGQNEGRQREILKEYTYLKQKLLEIKTEVNTQ